MQNSSQTEIAKRSETMILVGVRHSRNQPSAGLLTILTILVFLFASAALSLDELRLQRAARGLGPSAIEALVAWQKMYSTASNSPEISKLNIVNRFFNERIQFVDDVSVWGQHDYWATPLETLHKGAGDCEDYAIAKYFTLLAMKIPPASLRLVYVVAATTREGVVTFVPHMVLAFYSKTNTEPLVMDNLMASIVPASARPDLRPVFSFNTEGLWEQTGSVASTVPLDRLSRWRDLLQRISSEGFR